MTVTVQIGNSDNKLTQQRWSDFVRNTHILITEYPGVNIHFHGASEGSMPWQNACWVFEVAKVDAPALMRSVSYMGSQYKQESVAWTEGDTQFV